MANWFRIVVCPDCGAMREVDIFQKIWRCSQCKYVYEVQSTLWKDVYEVKSTLWKKGSIK